MQNKKPGCASSNVRHYLLMLFMFALGPLSAMADGNVVPCWSIEQSKKGKWFIAELVPESATFSKDGNVFEIAEAWVERAHRTDYILLTFPKRVVLPDYWVCIRVKENHGVRYTHGREFYVSYDADKHTKPGYGGFEAVYFTGKDPVLFSPEEKLRKEYIYSRVSAATREQKHTRDIVLRSKQNEKPGEG